MKRQRILTIQDISCVGRCSLTEALPILSAMGLETSILPTAVLSTHTGGFRGYTFHDLTDDMPKIKDHWKTENIRFELFYTGYIGSAKQLEYISDIIYELGTEDRKVIIDPVMGDQGRYYAGFSDEFAKKMAAFCGKADVILPNLTEAAFLVGEEYQESNHTPEYIERVLRRLGSLGCKNVLLTGVTFNEKELGVATYDVKNDKVDYYFNERIEGAFHGTGDLFASVFTGAIALEHSLSESARISVDYTLECIKQTPLENDRRYGVEFEKAIPYLVKRLGL